MKMLDCTCNDEITWFTCPLHGISRGVNITEKFPLQPHISNSDFIDLRNVDLNKSKWTIPLPNKTEEQKEFEKCKDFNYWFEKYYLPLKRVNTSSEHCFDCDQNF